MAMARRYYGAGISLVLLMAGAGSLYAQGNKPRLPGRIGVPDRGATTQPATTQQPSGSQVANSELAVGLLLPCCVLERVEEPTSLRARGRVLVLKNSSTGELHRVTVPGKASSAAGGPKYRPGQRVDMNIQKTALAITPFPVEEYKKKSINGNSAWVMRTWVTVSNNGRIDGKTRTKSAEAARGFTGGVEVLLTDRAGNILHQTRLRTYGVNGTAMGGKSDRTENWSETVSAETLNKVRAVVIHHSYEPKVRLAAGVGWIKDNWKVVHKVYKCGKELYDVATSDSSGGQPAPPPPPAPGQPTTQPPADNSTLECLEATADLLNNLGY